MQNHNIMFSINLKKIIFYLIRSNSPSVSPSFSQGDFSASRSPSPLDHKGNHHYTKNRISSRSPSPVLQFRPNNNQNTVGNINKSISNRGQIIAPPVTSQVNESSLYSQSIQQQNQLRKLPPLPSAHKVAKPIQQTSFRQISEESGDFEMANMPSSNQPTTQNVQKRTQPVQQQQLNQPKKQMPIISQPKPQPNYRAHNTIVSMNESVKLTKQYASIGDEDSDENENWF